MNHKITQLTGLLFLLIWGASCQQETNSGESTAGSQSFADSPDAAGVALPGQVPLPTGQVPLPQSESGGPQIDVPADEEPVLAPKQTGPVMIQTDDGEVVALHEPKRYVGRGADQVEVRRLSREEKTKRRTRKNLIMLIAGAVLLILTMVLLANLR